MNDENLRLIDSWVSHVFTTNGLVDLNTAYVLKTKKKKIDDNSTLCVSEKLIHDVGEKKHERTCANLAKLSHSMPKYIDKLQLPCV